MNYTKLTYIILLLFFSCEESIDIVNCIEHPNSDCPTVCTYSIQETGQIIDSCMYDISYSFSVNEQVDSYKVIFNLDTILAIYNPIDSTHSVNQNTTLICNDSTLVRVITYYPSFNCYSELLLAN